MSATNSAKKVYDTLPSVLSSENLTHWKNHGYLLLPSFFSQEEVSRMAAWITEISQWPMAEGRHLNYYEKNNGEFQLSRTENFLPYHERFRDFLKQSGVFEAMEQIMGESVVLFKEKINYKFPNSGAYPPHQDIHAHDTSPYAFQAYHINLVVFVDEANKKNGCMEFGWGSKKGEILDREPSGTLSKPTVDRLHWKEMACPAGSVLIFDVFWPHRSAINLDSKPRRTVFMTFNGKSNGDLREAHYRDRASGKPHSREIKSNLVVQTLLPQQNKKGG